ncbi:hypothetical protein, partial [Streptomyces sp. NPDC058461]
HTTAGPGNDLQGVLQHPGEMDEHVGTARPSGGSAELGGADASPIVTRNVATITAEPIAMPRSPVGGTAVLLFFVKWNRAAPTAAATMRMSNRPVVMGKTVIGRPASPPGRR